MKKSVYENQIRNLLEVFHLVEEVFETQKPLDYFFRGYFRRHKKFGSKDRAFISNSIYGFYRWYGWLKKFRKNSELALLLGYLLDLNPVDEKIEHWIELVGFNQSDVSELYKEKSILSKQQFVAKHSDHTKLSYLQPTFFPSYSDEQVNVLQTRAPFWLRIRDHHVEEVLVDLNVENIQYEYFEQFKNSVLITTKINIEQYQFYKNKKIYIQDLSSQMIVKECDPKEGESWWDVCAGAGGKSIHLLDHMNGKGSVYATDIRESILGNLERRMPPEYKGHINTKVLKDDAPKEKNSFDGILVDAPCSSTGTCRRNPEIRWYYEESDILEFQKMQLEILDKVKGNVKKNGKLVYSTCSQLSQENEDVIQQFLDLNDNFEILKTVINSEIENIEKKFLPPKYDGNIMYVAVLKRID